MKKPNNVHPSVNINAGVLKNDRRMAGFTQVSFAAACGSVSLATIRRAEQGHRIIISALRRIAIVLNQDHDRYIAADEPKVESGYVAWIEGKWTGFSVEADLKMLPHIVTAEISIIQIGDRIEGRSVCSSPTGIHIEQYLDCKIYNNVLTGFRTVDSTVLPNGLTSLNQVISRDNDWIEGFSAWYEINTGRTEWSRTIDVRNGCQNFDRYVEEAHFLITRELTIYSMRKLVESGYAIRDAVTMLNAVEVQNDALEKKSVDQV